MKGTKGRGRSTRPSCVEISNCCNLCGSSGNSMGAVELMCALGARVQQPGSLGRECYPQGTRLETCCA